MTRTLNPRDRARNAFQKAVVKANVQAREHATVGWRRSETTVQFAVPGRPGHIYVTKQGTVYPALNRAGVPQQAFLPVWVILENDTYVIVARDNANAAALANVPDNVYGVTPHPLTAHSDVAPGSTPADGETLIWSEGDQVWDFGAPSAVGVLDDLTDVTITTPSDNQFLMYAAGNWVNSAVAWSWITGKPATFTPSAHAASHRHGGTDEVATATPAANAIPKAGVSGKLANGWLEAKLAAIAGLTGAADRLPYFTSASAASLAPFTAFGRSLVDDADAAEGLATLGAVARDGSTPLTADWDIGEDRRILLEALRARDAEGVKIEDDGGNVIIDIPDGGGIVVQNIAGGDLITFANGLSITEAGTVYKTGFIQSLNNGTIAFTIVRGSASNPMMQSAVSGDTNRRFAITVNGNFVWGPGNAAFDTNLYRSAANHLKTDDDLIVTGDLSAGVDAAQGKAHFHDGVGGSMFVTKTGVAGTKVVIIDGAVAGDVLSVITGLYCLQNSDGSKTGGLFTIPNPGSHAVTIGGTTWTFSVAVSGEFSVIRTTATADTATIAMQLVWR